MIPAPDQFLESKLGRWGEGGGEGVKEEEKHVWAFSRATMPSFKQTKKKTT